MTTTEQQVKLAAHLWAITDFCMKDRKAGVLWDWTRDKVFRFVAFCFYTGRLAVAFEGAKIECVAFYWLDFIEIIEARHERNQPQFQWGKCHGGDCLFLGDVIGNRVSVGKIYQGVIEKWPHVVMLPIMTYRKGALVRVNIKTLNRFLK